MKKGEINTKLYHGLNNYTDFIERSDRDMEKL